MKSKLSKIVFLISDVIKIKKNEFRLIYYRKLKSRVAVNYSNRENKSKFFDGC